MVLLFSALKTDLTLRSGVERGKGKKNQGESRISVHRETGTPVVWLQQYLAEFVPQLLLQKCARICFPFCNMPLCFMQDFLHGYEEHAARNFMFKATPNCDARGDTGA